ncbi:wings apart-like protein regulation of heterochromatin-domain-containing protein [Bisporella sp. PMI_857]|nr:wings apart-like protein regulation of heterochromatin-domain-containing protein [Bisporella sp. PMI_857]
MAAQDEGVFPIPKKRITTYGKASRKRIPDQGLAPRIREARSPEKKQSSFASRSSSVPLAEPKGLKSPQKRPSPSSTASASTSIFDVPSSDDDTILSVPKNQKTAHNPVIRKPTSKVISTKETFVTLAAEVDRAKRVKLSPMRALPSKSPSDVILRKKETIATEELSKPFTLGRTSNIASRPKHMPTQQKPEEASAQSNTSASLMHIRSGTPPLSDTDMMDVDLSTSKHISPRGQQMWEDLLAPVDLYLARDKAIKSSAKKVDKLLYNAAGVSKPVQRPARNIPRRRLIDSLVEQASYEDDLDEYSLSAEDADITSTKETDPNGLKISRNQSPVPEVTVKSSITAQVPLAAGPRFTYSRQRSMLAEDDLMSQLALDLPSQPVQAQTGRRPRRGSIPKLTPLQSFHEDEEDNEGVSSQNIRSVHELRQAGANSRFLDEIEDLLDRIGKPAAQPSSSRRSSLLELAGKFKDKNFVRQFRSNGIEQRLFVHLGLETDLLSGFLIISILMVLLLDTSMPHVVAQLQRQGITRLLIRLLDSQASIVTLSKERKSNMSKMAQSLITQHQNFLLQVPVWEDLQPQSLSTRTVALKCLELMVRQTREAGNSGDLISKELTTRLFAILQSISEDDSWDLPSGQKAIDFYLALSTLESHSITARTVHDESIWISDYLPIVAESLEVALNRSIDNFGTIQALILRLTLNVTNNNPSASDVFARGPLMAVMGTVLITKFHKILRFLTEEDLSTIVDHLVLVLGVMINFADGSSAARESVQSLQGKENDPLDSIVQLFVDNVARAHEAESFEESQKNVAFGYLSVLLGYLSLLPAISERIAAQQPRKTLRPLVTSIEEFIGHHKVADSQFEADDEGYNANIGLTERLEELVLKLSSNY